MKDVLTILAIFLFAIYSFGIIHESTHAEIYKQYGCENVSINPLPTHDSFMSTTASCPPEKGKSIRRAQSNVENVQYGQFTIYMILVTMLVIYMINEHLL